MLRPTNREVIMEKSKLPLVVWLPLTGFSLDEIIDKVVEEDLFEKRQRSKETQKQFLEKKNKRHKNGRKR